MALNCLVLPETLDYLKSAPGSQGSVVDRAVAALKTQIAQGRVMADTGDPWKALAEPGDRWKTQRPPTRSLKRGPREKGDKTR